MSSQSHQSDYCLLWLLKCAEMEEAAIKHCGNKIIRWIKENTRFSLHVPCATRVRMVNGEKLASTMVIILMASGLQSIAFSPLLYFNSLAVYWNVCWPFRMHGPIRLPLTIIAFWNAARCVCSTWKTNITQSEKPLCNSFMVWISKSSQFINIINTVHCRPYTMQVVSQVG